MAYSNYMEDCIHLHACRRLQARYKSMGFTGARACNEDCTAYMSGSVGDYISVDEAVDYARRGASSIRAGYDEFDEYCSCDLQGMTIEEIINTEKVED